MVGRTSYRWLLSKRMWTWSDAARFLSLLAVVGCVYGCIPETSHPPLEPTLLVDGGCEILPVDGGGRTTASDAGLQACDDEEDCSVHPCASASDCNAFASCSELLHCNAAVEVVCQAGRCLSETRGVDGGPATTFSPLAICNADGAEGCPSSSMVCRESTCVIPVGAACPVVVDGGGN